MPPALPSVAHLTMFAGSSKESRSQNCSKQSCFGSRSYADVAERVEARVGLVQLSGRYHKAPRTIETDYELTNVALGSGVNGVVKLATSKSYSSHTFAVKSFEFAGVPLSKREQLESEVEVFLSIDHPHIARLSDVYEYDEHIYLVMENMEGGELFDRISKLKRFTECDAAESVWQMLLALNYIHSHGIVHGDVKLENFMYDSPACNHLKLIDFGFSKMRIDEDGVLPNKKICGTISYIAPEALERRLTTPAGDQWSLGVVVFVLLSGYMPFNAVSQREQMRNISEGRYVMREERWATISPEARSFTEELLQVNATDRLSAQAALNHPFLQVCRTQRRLEVDSSIACALRNFAHQSRFRRCCLSMIAWSLSNEERAKVEESFLAFDEHHTGTISFDEWKKVMVGKFHLPNSEVKKSFQVFDTHHDKEIHYSVFLAAMVNTQIQLSDEHTYECFRRFDTHNVGYITLKDLREVLGDTVEGERVEHFLDEADPLKRGYITYHDFVAYMTGKPLRLHGDEVPFELDVHEVDRRRSPSYTQMARLERVTAHQPECCFLH